MGVYIYNMRKRTVPIWVDGQRVAANWYSYAFKEWLCWGFGDEERRRNFIRENAARIGQDAFHSERSGFVLLGDAKNGAEDCTVYRDVTSGVWTDTTAFPGTPVGFVHKEGRKWVVRPVSKWHPWKIMVDGDWVDHERRLVVNDENKIVEETKRAA